MEIGNQYFFKYPEIKFNFSGIINSWQIELSIILPKEIISFEENDYYILKIENINSILYNDDYVINFPFIRTNILPNVKGKNKWILNKEEITSIKIQDLPDIIECSLNTYEHPSKRNWFVHKNCGFTNQDYSKIDWELWDNYGYLIQYSEVTLYFRFLCELLKLEVDKRGVQVYNFEDWISIIKEQILYDNKFKLKERHINELCEDYARDFLYIW